MTDSEIYTHTDNDTPVTIKSLLSRTWWIILNNYQGNDQDTLKESLIRALGQCREDDGHRVCNIGRSQRIAIVLQGYMGGIKIDDYEQLPKPIEFMSAFLKSKAEETQNITNEPKEKQIQYAQQLRLEAKEQAEHLYGDQVSAIKEALDLIENFIRYSLDS